MPGGLLKAAAGADDFAGGGAVGAASLTAAMGTAREFVVSALTTGNVAAKEGASGLVGGCATLAAGLITGKDAPAGLAAALVGATGCGGSREGATGGGFVTVFDTAAAGGIDAAVVTVAIATGMVCEGIVGRAVDAGAATECV